MYVSRNMQLNDLESRIRVFFRNSIDFEKFNNTIQKKQKFSSVESVKNGFNVYKGISNFKPFDSFCNLF